jgi:MauM/NapG family ferredoxin protein
MRATEYRGQGANPGEAGSFPLLRPPGAIAESEFLAACTRCDDCASACPHDAIRSAPTRLREAADTPIIDPLRAPCLLCEDLPCITACETGALRIEAPATLGTARIQPLDCLNRLGSPCSVCVERCPVTDALTMQEGLPVVNESICTGCGVCQHVCPAPGAAILMLPNPERPTTQEIEEIAARATSTPTPAHEISPDASEAQTTSKGSPASNTSVAGGEDHLEEIELPDLHEGLLDILKLRSLIADLTSLTDVIEVRTKGARGARSSSARIDLETAGGLLETGEIGALQINYSYQGEFWCDTILAGPEGFRVLRMATPKRVDSHA